MKRKYKSEALEALHETVRGLHKIGLITDGEMRAYDDGCLVKPVVTVPHGAAQEPVSTMRLGTSVYARGK
jgi:putative transcriptional regulator